MATVARRIKPYAVPALAFAAIVLAMFWRLWTGIDGAQKTFGWDAQWEYWGDLQFQLDAYRAGELPLWNPFDRGGYPFHADPQAGILYPVTWVLLLIGALAGGAPWWLIAVKIAFHFWLAGLGVYAFLRRRGTPVAACYAGGLVFILTYPFVHNLFSALNWSMAWAPWALLAVDAWAERPSVGRGALVALALAMGQLAGALAAFWYTLLIVAPYAVWAVLHHGRAAAVGEDRRADPDRRRDPTGPDASRHPSYVRTAARSAGVALALFVGMVAAQLSATGALVGETVRDKRDYGFITDTAFTPDDLMGFVIPRLPGENLYMGFAVILCVVAILTMKPTPRKLVLAGIALAGVLCAWGHIGGYLPFGASVVPPFGYFRRAHRYFYVTVLPLAILGAEGLAELAALEGEELRKRVGRVLLGAGALAILIFGIGFVVKASTPDKNEPYRDAYALGFAAAATSAWLLRQIVAKDGRERRAFLGIAAVVIGLDLMIARAHVIDRNFYPLPDVKRDGEIAGLTDVPEHAARVYDREYFKFRPGLRQHVRDLGGYEGDPLALRRYSLVRDTVAAKPALLGHFNVRWLTEAGNKVTPKPAGGAALRQVRPGVWEVLKVAPAVLWVDTARVVDGDEKAALKELEQLPPGTIAVLERATAGTVAASPAITEGAPGAVAPGRITHYSRRSLTAEVDAPADGLVVIAEAYYPGWSATVDGAPAPIVPANVMFRAIVVPAGHHTIVMRYSANRYLALVPVSLASLIAALVLALHRRNPQ